MKKCPFCAEGIQDDAIKCKHCGEWLSNEKMKLPTKSPDIQPIGKNKDNENYEFRCAFCKSNVGINDLECPNCGKNLGESEINEDELENIISTGPEKAYTTLATLLDTGKKEKTIALGERFINKYPTSRQAKWASKIIEDAKRLESRKLKIIKEKEKFCPNCKRIMEMTQAICQCG
ncbi:MAG TPA: hypothetical protein ENG89_02300, partial [Candidatus Moranbacteria bacterium]|nr:hypothetical protein [Candidatus Moranbacteria bacterium]